jgi:small-conductance mechanosensitive channel
VAEEGAPEQADVKIGDAVVFSVLAPRAGQGAAERARDASAALSRAVERVMPDDIRSEPGPDGVTVFAGADPIITLTETDALFAGHISLEVHAATVVQQVREAVRKEKERSAIATTVFSLSLVVFLGLIAIYLIRKVSDFAERARVWLEDNAAKIPAVRLWSIEVVRPALLHSTLTVVLMLGRWLGQIGLVYTWLVIVLSMFESTRGYTDKLTGYVVAPLSALMGRAATSLPLLLVAAVAAIALILLVRFVGLFFEGVTRGEASIGWLPRDLVRPTSLLMRASIVLATLVFAAPVITGDPEGALARTGTVAVYAIGVAIVPILASSIIGVVVLYGRRFRIGEHAEIGDQRGRIKAINLLEVVLHDGGGVDVRVPYLLLLLRPTRLLGRLPRVAVELDVPQAGAAIEEALLAAAGEVGDEPLVELMALDRAGARYRVSARSAKADAAPSLLAGAARALAAAVGMDEAR